MLTNSIHTVIYTGVTNNLLRRLEEHKSTNQKSFTSQYKTNILVYYEEFTDIYDAITREKQIKGDSRDKKISLITKANPHWKDLI